jgi:hypothetical protein
MTAEECPRCVLLGRMCPFCESKRMLDDHNAWFTEHFTREDDWPEGERAAGLADAHLAAAKRQEELAGELEELALVPQDIELAGAMRQTASMLRLWAARRSGPSGQN